MRYLLTTMLLTVVGVGLIWQSGYLARPLGLIPVFASYSEATPNAPVSKPVAELESGQVIHRSNPVVHSLPASANQEVERVALPVVAVAETATEPRPVAVDEAPSLQPRLVQDRPISKPHPYALRVAAYKRSSKWAVAAVEQLREAGQRAFLVPIAGRSADKNYFCYVQSRGGDTHRVLAGAFETDEEARIFLGKFDGARIVRR